MASQAKIFAILGYVFEGYVFRAAKNLHVVVVVVVVVVGLYIWPLGPENPVSAPLFPRTAGV